ncbi:MAG: RDD family protein [Micropruina sp.]|uniref:RDD family protein n=1 Tax=Micropruina sp. TaxID=2737536 RepID=UPI0039E6A73F
MKRESKHWWRRVAGYLIGTILPWSLLAQLLGTIVVGRSSPDSDTGQWLGRIAFLVVIVASALLSKNGQSPAHRLLRLQVLDPMGAPASQTRMGLRALAHLADVATLGLGFLWPLWDREGQTFGDKLAGTTVRYSERAQTGA